MTDVSARPVPPGALLVDELKERSWAVGDLSNAATLHPNTVWDLLCGKLPIDGRLSVALGRALGTSPDFWLNMQQGYDRAMQAQAARAAAPAPQPRYRISIALAGGHIMQVEAAGWEPDERGVLCVDALSANGERASVLFAPGVWASVATDWVSRDGGQTWVDAIVPEWQPAGER